MNTRALIMFFSILFSIDSFSLENHEASGKKSNEDCLKIFDRKVIDLLTEAKINLKDSQNTLKDEANKKSVEYIHQMISSSIKEEKLKLEKKLATQSRKLCNLDESEAIENIQRNINLFLEAKKNYLEIEDQEEAKKVKKKLEKDEARKTANAEERAKDLKTAQDLLTISDKAKKLNYTHFLADYPHIQMNCAQMQGHNYNCSRGYICPLEVLDMFIKNIPNGGENIFTQKYSKMCPEAFNTEGFELILKNKLTRENKFTIYFLSSSDHQNSKNKKVWKEILNERFEVK